MSEKRKAQELSGGKSMDQETRDGIIERIEKAVEEGEHTVEVTVDSWPSWNVNTNVLKENESIPQERIEELADYYDHTDTAELEGEDVTDQVKIEEPEDMEQVSIRLPRDDLEQIRRRASAAGVGYTTMIRMIVHAHLENPLTY